MSGSSRRWRFEMREFSRLWGVRAGGACCSAHARGQSPGRSPSTNSPLDCLCPGSLPRAGRDSALLLYFAHQHGPAARSYAAWCLFAANLRGMQPSASGGQLGEVKGEGRALPPRRTFAELTTRRALPARTVGVSIRKRAEAVVRKRQQRADNRPSRTLPDIERRSFHLSRSTALSATRDLSRTQCRCD